MLPVQVGMGSISGQGTKSPQSAAQHGQNIFQSQKKKKKKKSPCYIVNEGGSRWEGNFL